jgi:MFS superfamily sulfate permease-like transporter
LSAPSSDPSVPSGVRVPGDVPADGLAALPRSWRADLTSGFLVFLIALPLCIGISMAAQWPPLAGVFTAIVGGLVATWLGSAHLTIKGPAAGLISIALGAVTELGAGNPADGYHKALAVGVVAAVIQIAFAVAKAGTLAEMFPSSVLNGMLAAIGVIIFSKQIHVALGVKPQGKEPLELLAEIPHSLAHLNPAVALIGGLSLVVLFGWPKVPLALARKIPAQMVVLALAVPLGLVLGLGHDHAYTFGGQSFQVGPGFLVDLGRNADGSKATLFTSYAFPDFSDVLSSTSLKYVVMFALVGTIESMLSAKAIDGLDPWKRKASMDQDLLAVGVGNLLSSAIGGLPMISEIVRSSANIDQGARTRWANFFHGLFLLVFVAALPWLIEMIPTAALAAMLVYTGLRLASPAEFRKTFQIGWEQLAVFTSTLVTTLATDLLVGVAVGIAVKIALHVYHGAPLASLLKPEVEVTTEAEDTLVTVRRAAVFSNYLGLRKALGTARSAAPSRIVVDLSGAALVDHTVMEKLHELETDLAAEGRSLVVRGLDGHRPISSHPLAARRRTPA